MIELLIASNALAGIAVLLVAIGVQRLHKAQAIENEALRREVRELEKSGDAPVIHCLSKVDVAPGDTVVLTTEHFLTREQHAAIKDHLEKALPGLRTIVLTGGLRAAGVLAPTEHA